MTENKDANPQTPLPDIAPWYADWRLYLLVFAVLVLFMLKAVFGTGYSCRQPALHGDRVDAPAFSVTRLDGTQRSLSDLRGKVVFLNFWATWCGPCVSELPEIEDLQKKYGERDDFEILAVSCDEAKTKNVRDFVEDYNDRRSEVPLTFPIYHDPELKTAGAFGVAGFPTTFLIDKTGQVRKYFVGPRDWSDRHFRDTLEEMLAESAPTD